MNLEKINEVIKASPAIQIQSKISLLQRRAWNVLLANAYNELPDKDIHTVSMVELAAKLGFDSKNEEYLKEMLRSLRSCEVEWNLLNKDNKQEWGIAGLLAEARIVDGICFYQFPHTLRLKTSQSTRLCQVEPTPPKSLQKPIRLRLMGNLFRLFRYRPRSGRNTFHSNRNFQIANGFRRSRLS